MKKVLKNKWIIEFLKIFGILIGTFFMGLGFNCFFLASDIAPGGFSGLAAMISNLLCYKLNWFYISPTIIYLSFNSILLIFAVRIFGKKYFLNAIIGIVSYSICIEYAKFDFGLNDIFLGCIFGSVLLGVGTGLVVRMGGSTGGSDMLGMILNRRNKEITVGKIIIMVDIVVLVLSFANFGLINSLYTILAIYLTGKITDIVIDGGKGTKAYYIISDKISEISQALTENFLHGATIIDGTGVFSKKEKDIILCLVNKYEARALKGIVFKIDSKAFLFSTNVIEAFGENYTNDFNIDHEKIEKSKKQQAQKEEISQKENEQQNERENVQEKAEKEKKWTKLL